MKISGNTFVLTYRANPEIEEWEDIPIGYLKLLLNMHMLPVVNKRNKNEKGSTLVVSYCDKFYTFEIPEEFYTDTTSQDNIFVNIIYDILEQSGTDMHMNIDDPFNFIEEDVNLEIPKLYRQIALLILENIELRGRIENSKDDLITQMIDNLQPISNYEDNSINMDGFTNIPINEMDPETIDFVSRYSKDQTGFENFVNHYYPNGFSTGDNTTTNKTTNIDNFYKDPAKSTGFNKNNFINPGESKTTTVGNSYKIEDPTLNNFVNPTYEELLNTCNNLTKINRTLTQTNEQYKVFLDHTNKIINSIYSIINNYLNNNISDFEKEINNKTIPQYNSNNKLVLTEEQSAAVSALIDVDASVVDHIIEVKEPVIFSYTMNPIKKNNIIHNLGLGIIIRDDLGEVKISPVSKIPTDAVITGIYFMTPEIKNLLNFNNN